MPKVRKPPKPKPQQLLVEGKNDRHVIWALCEKYQVPETFSVEVPKAEEGQGIEVLLADLPFKLREDNLHTLGIVVDADEDVSSRWDAVGNRLRYSGYENLPASPPAEGWVYSPQESNLPKVGVWLMPNNQLPGMLEDFVAHLIEPDDKLLPFATSILQQIEEAGINQYSLVRRPKAFIHTCLAWQEASGMPIGQAITADRETMLFWGFYSWSLFAFSLSSLMPYVRVNYFFYPSVSLYSSSDIASASTNSSLVKLKFLSCS